MSRLRRRRPTTTTRTTRKATAATTGTTGGWAMSTTGDGAAATRSRPRCHWTWTTAAWEGARNLRNQKTVGGKSVPTPTVLVIKSKKNFKNVRFPGRGAEPFFLPTPICWQQNGKEPPLFFSTTIRVINRKRPECFLKNRTRFIAYTIKSNRSRERSSSSRNVSTTCILSQNRPTSVGPTLRNMFESNPFWGEYSRCRTSNTRQTARNNDR